MRFLKWVIIFILILIVLGGVALFVFLKTFDINKYRPQIAQAIGQSLKRDVFLGDLSLNYALGKQMVLTVKNLKVSDHPDFSSEAFLEIKQVDCGLDTQALVFNRKLVITSIELNSPVVQIIRNQKGEMNVQKLKKETSKKLPPPVPKEENKITQSLKARVASQEAEAREFLSTLLIKAIQLNNGSVKYIDQTFTPALVIDVKSIAFKIDGFSLNESFSFELGCSVFSDRQNIQLKGKAIIDQPNMKVTVNDFDGKLNISQETLDQFKQSFGYLKELESIKSGKGDIRVRVPMCSVTASGMGDCSLKAELGYGRLEIAEIPSPIEAINATILMDQQDVGITDASFQIGKGLISLKGKIKDFLKTQSFTLIKTFDDIEILDVYPQEGQENQLSGIVSGEFSLEGSGLKYPEILDTLRGDGQVKIKEGKITNINILREVLSNISKIPGLATDLTESIPKRYEEVLKKEDTSLKDVVAVMRISEGQYIVDALSITSDAFFIEGKGQMSFDNRLKAKTQIFLPEDMSEMMTVKNKNMRYLLDEQKRVTFPLTLNGKIPRIIPLPDMNYLTKKMVREVGKEKLKEVLNKALGRDDEEAQESVPQQEGQPSPQEGQPAPQEEEPSFEEELIGNILDGLFR